MTKHPANPPSRRRRFRLGRRLAIARRRLPRILGISRPDRIPGVELEELAHMPSRAGSVAVTCIDYGQAQWSAEEVTDIEAFVARHRPDWSVVRWINVDGLTDLGVVRALGEKYNLHPLAIEDVLHVSHRPKVEPYVAEGRYQARLFVIVRMLDLQDGRLHSEQISVFLGHNTVLTFQESPGDVWDVVRQRIRTAGSRLRNHDAGFLVHSLLDAIVDSCFPILEHYGDRLEEVEIQMLERPSPAVIQEIHVLKRELLLLRRAAWPMREVVNTLQREPHDCLSDETRTYMRDVYDHTVQIIDIIETYREVAMGLTETYMTSMSNRLNEVMKVLTIIGTIFIPLTFLAGVYGMNFRHLPELEWRWGYAAFWGISVVVAGAMMAWFRSRRWL